MQEPKVPGRDDEVNQSDDGLLRAALKYAEQGFEIFPLVPGSKMPFPGSHGVHDATVNPAKIKEWWAAHPKANIGLNVGKSGLTIIDLDEKHGNHAVALWKEQGLPDPGGISHTPSNGLHLWFAGVTPSKFLNGGVEIKSDGTYVALPPSGTPKGQYVYENLGTITAIPQGYWDWFRTLGEPPKAVAAPKGAQQIPKGARHN
jgi:hypothetical protein